MRIFIAVNKFAMVSFAYHSKKETDECVLFEIDFAAVPTVGDHISAEQGNVLLIVRKVVWEIPARRIEHHPVIFCEVDTDDRH